MIEEPVVELLPSVDYTLLIQQNIDLMLKVSSQLDFLCSCSFVLIMIAIGTILFSVFYGIAKPFLGR